MIICMLATYMQRVVFSERVCCIIFQLHVCVESYMRVHACCLTMRVFMSGVCVSHA